MSTCNTITAKHLKNIQSLKEEIGQTLKSATNEVLKEPKPESPQSQGDKQHIVNYLPCSWIDLVTFTVIDAAQGIKRYQDKNGKDVTHIYSYNKVMSQQDREGICKILNRTNYRVLAWYFGPDDTSKAGLENFRFLVRIPMQSTGGEKFSVFIYIKEQKTQNSKQNSIKKK